MSTTLASLSVSCRLKRLTRLPGSYRIAARRQIARRSMAIPRKRGFAMSPHTRWRNQKFLGNLKLGFGFAVRFVERLFHVANDTPLVLVELLNEVRAAHAFPPGVWR